MRLLVPLLWIFCTAMADPKTVELDTRGKVMLSWIIKEDVITMELIVETLGYVAVGFSPSGGMKGADIVMASVDNQDGTILFKDMHAEGEVTPEEDPSQDYELITATQNDTHTTVKFKRHMVTCDQLRDMPLGEDTVSVIWAYGSRDYIHYHGPVDRGTRNLYLTSFLPSPWKHQEIQTYKTWDIINNNLILDDDLDTTYWCKIFKVPDLKTKHQIVGFVPVISSGNEGYVHHILLYECFHVNRELFGKFLDHGGEHCYTPNMPDEWNYCEKVVIAWAVGSRGEMFPMSAGAPMGYKFSGVDYYMLEVHYDNPSWTPGIIDNSGVRLFYTDKLRQYDSGTLTVGHPVTPLQAIPPNLDSYTTVATCDGSCTSLLFPPEGIRSFQVLFHAHTYGRAIRLRHFRNGTELDPIAQDNHYDFDYQQTRAVHPEVVVLPGDTLMTECSYTTKGKHKVTFGGLSTKDEMCLVFLYYYPRVNASVCLSTPTAFDVASVFGAEYDHPEKIGPIIHRNGAVDEFVAAKLGGYLRPHNVSLPALMFGGIKWNPEIARRLQTVTTTRDHILHCVAEGSVQLVKPMTMVSLPTNQIGQYSEEYAVKTPDRCRK